LTGSNGVPAGDDLLFIFHFKQGAVLGSSDEDAAAKAAPKFLGWPSPVPHPYVSRNTGRPVANFC